MRRALVGLSLLGALIAVGAVSEGCGGSDVGQAQMALHTSGLEPSQLAAVEVLVLGGPSATCARALAGHSPVDDSALDILAHARFSAAGGVEHLRLPAHQPLVFYAEGLDGNDKRVGRGCTPMTLDGDSTPVVITITASD